MQEALPGWRDAERVAIAGEQQRRENVAARSANKVLICDTNAFATGLWCERYQGRRVAAVDAIGAKDVVHLYLLAEPDFPYVQDGFRDGEKIRDWMHQRFVEEIAKTGVPCVRQRGGPEARHAAATGAVDALIASYVIA